jgi:hypothetical protein
MLLMQIFNHTWCHVCGLFYHFTWFSVKMIYMNQAATQMVQYTNPSLNTVQIKDTEAVAEGWKRHVWLLLRRGRWQDQVLVTVRMFNVEKSMYLMRPRPRNILFGMKFTQHSFDQYAVITRPPNSMRRIAYVCIWNWVSPAILRLLVSFGTLVLTMVKSHNVVWVRTPCSLVHGYQCFGRTHGLSLYTPSEDGERMLCLTLDTQLWNYMMS